jgi:hypothetical protein
MAETIANVGIEGIITAKFYDQSVLGFIDQAANALLRALRPRWPSLMRFYRLGELKGVQKKKNIICYAGINALIRRLGNDFSYSGFINRMALGTGSPTPATSDTQLATEVYRNVTASGSASSNVAYLTGYFTETECSGTYTEFGNFIDGTATANSGKLWSHIASISWAKNSSTCLVVSCQYTVTNT